MKDNYFAAWFVGETKLSEEATAIVEKYKNCPHIYFMSQKENRIYGIFILGMNQKWWIEYVEQHPGEETLGFKNISITYLNDISYPDSFRIQDYIKSLEKSPCGSDCFICPQYERCTGCPATIHYKL